MHFVFAFPSLSVTERPFFSDNLQRHGQGAEDCLFPNRFPDEKWSRPTRLGLAGDAAADRRAKPRFRARCRGNLAPAARDARVATRRSECAFAARVPGTAGGWLRDLA